MIFCKTFLAGFRELAFGVFVAVVLGDAALEALFRVLVTVTPPFTGFSSLAMTLPAVDLFSAVGWEVPVLLAAVFFADGFLLPAAVAGVLFTAGKDVPVVFSMANCRRF